MKNPRLSPARVRCAYTVAVLADFIQLPINAAFTTGALALPAEAADAVIDLTLTGMTSLLLGFHWALLPTFALEALPGVSALPTWTGCVAFVVWQRRKGETDSEFHT